VGNTRFICHLPACVPGRVLFLMIEKKSHLR
jgi:hypothetical protein